MKHKYLFGLIVVGFFLSGCATTSGRGSATMSDNRVNMLETRVAMLENRLDVFQERQNAMEFSLKRNSVETVEAPRPISVASRPLPKKDILTKKDIQTALKNAGFYDGPIDGIIGANTKKAIRAFQKANGLKSDGIAGKKTRALLSEHLTE